MITSCFRNFGYARSVKMDTSDTSGDLTDSQWNVIGESYLTNSQFEDLFSDWSQRDKPENDCIQRGYNTSVKLEEKLNNI